MPKFDDPTDIDPNPKSRPPAPSEDAVKLRTAEERYQKALRAMHRAVLYSVVHGTAAAGGSTQPAIADSHEASPKHLLIGVNSALIDGAAIVALLVRKGVFSQVEFVEELAAQAEAEVARYHRRYPALAAG